MQDKPTVLFRNESYSGSMVRDAVDVLSFEIGELHNTDIIDYCLAHYNLCRMHFDQTLDALRELIDDGDTVDGSDIRILMRDLLKHIESNTGFCITHVLWLAPEETVKSMYEGSGKHLDAYLTGPVILSDLGPDGILFGYTAMPTPLTT